MENLHAFTIKYLGPTNTKGSRVKITSERFEQSKTFAYNYTYSNIVDMAEEYLQKFGFNLVGVAETSKGFIILSDTFKELR